jgi:hypothetical protein
MWGTTMTRVALSDENLRINLEWEALIHEFSKVSFQSAYVAYAYVVPSSGP